MWGNRYWGARYFGARFWGKEGGTVTYTRAPSGGGYVPRQLREGERVTSTPATRPRTGGGRSNR